MDFFAQQSFFSQPRILLNNKTSKRQSLNCCKDVSSIDQSDISTNDSLKIALSKFNSSPVEIINAFCLRIIKNFECYKYSYEFIPEISFQLKLKIFSFIEGIFFNETHLFIPKRNIPDSFARWFRTDEMKFLKDDIKLMINFVEIIHDKYFIIKELLFEISTIIRENYFQINNYDRSCEEYILNTFPGLVVKIKEIKEDDKKSLAVLTLVSKKTILITNVHDRIMIFKNFKNFQNFRSFFNLNLLKKKVISKHTGKTYIIEDINTDITATCKLSQSDIGRQDTYKDFFENFFDLKIKYDDQYVLFCKENPQATKLIALLPEFCEIIEEDINILVNEQECRQKFYKFINIASQDTNIARICEIWGFSFTSQHSSMNLKQLDIRAVLKGFTLSPNDSQYMNTEWFAKQWKHFYRQPFSKKNSEYFKTWGMITPPLRICRIVLENFLNSISNIAMEAKISINNPHQISLSYHATPQDYVDAIEKLYYEYDIAFVIVILRNISHDFCVYNIIKKYCSSLDIALQVVKLPTIDCPDFYLNNITANIISQINCKLGGIPWAIEMPFDHIMFIGVHMFEDVIAFSANTDSNSRTWLFESCFLQQFSEFEENLILGSFLKKAIFKYIDKNRRFPIQVVIIRNFNDCSNKKTIESSVLNDINIVECVLRQLVLHSSFSNSQFIYPPDYIPEFFYLKIYDYTEWKLEDSFIKNCNMIISLMSPYFTMKSLFPTMLHIHHPKVFPIVNSNRSRRRIESIQDLQLSLIVQSHLYFNSATFCPLPAVCMNAQRLAIYSKKVLGENVCANEKFSFL